MTAIGKTGKEWVKVTDSEVEVWRTLVNNGLSYREVGRMFNRGHKTISQYIESKPAKQKQTIEQKRAYRKAYRDSLNGLLYGAANTARRRAGLKNMEFDLDVPFLMALHDSQGGVCALTGLSFSTEREVDGRSNPYTLSLDRIDSSQGYVRGNVRLVIWGINWAIGQWGEETYADIARAYFANRKGTNESKYDSNGPTVESSVMGATGTEQSA